MGNTPHIVCEERVYTMAELKFMFGETGIVAALIQKIEELEQEVNMRAGGRRAPAKE